MCGIAGVAYADRRPVDLQDLLRMAAALRHRGPDGFGYLVDPGIGLAHCRLSIIDLDHGAQPLTGCGERCWITFNGEIYNYIELRARLEASGHCFHSASDTEVIVHAIEEWGLGALDRFNGDFAFALYDRRDGSILLARDRFGVRPLFYALTPDGGVGFASEVKALFAGGVIEPAIDAVGLEQVFRFWAARPPRTVFNGVSQLPPGCWARWHQGRFETGRWWQPEFEESRREPADAIAQLDQLMRSSVALRMRADVPVGAYLSGGLDSSITCALAARSTPHRLRTFSVSFADPSLDESVHQEAVAGAIGSEHAVQRIGADEIALAFPEVVRHAETPLMRTAAAPLYLLSRLTRERGITVVLTGEGSDEVFLGYDLFKEAALRRFCLRQPASRSRPRLFDRLYPYLQSGGAGELWWRFFLDAGSPDDPLFSHLPRFQLGSFMHGFRGPALTDALAGVDVLADLRASLPQHFHRWSSPNQAAYLEMTTLLDGYLLASQGDRMAMAHGVEGRFPFLDHRLFEFAAALPARSKLRGLQEKAILRRWAGDVVPPAVRNRPKQPYRAPDAPAFFGPRAPTYVEEMLTPAALQTTGLFDPAAVTGLVRRCRNGTVRGARENQALVAVLSAQIWHSGFISQLLEPAPLDPASANVAVGRRELR